MIRKTLTAIIAMYQVIIHLVLIVLGGTFGMIASLIILISFGSTAANDFIDRYMDLLLTINATKKENA